MVEQDVVATDGGEDVGLALQPLGQAGHERLVLELVDVDLVDQRREPHDVDGAVAAVQVVPGELELREQEAGEVLGTARSHFEAQRHSELAVLELALQRLAQVLDLFLVDPQIGVARDAELRVRDDLAAGKEVRQMRMDHRRQQQELVLGLRDVGRQLDHARDHARRLDDRDGGQPAESVEPRQLDDEVQALVDDLRERVRRIEPDRRQQRPHLALEEIGHPRPLGRRAIRVPDQAHAVLRERRKELLVQHAVLIVHQCAGAARDLGQRRAHLGERHAGRGNLRAQLLLQARDADLEELVEIAADDAAEAQALEQGDVGILRQREHAAVEREQ
jgi:hypothetical protein